MLGRIQKLVQIGGIGRRLRYGWLLVGLTACEPTLYCVTSNNVGFVGVVPNMTTPKHWSCSELEQSESTMVRLMSGVNPAWNGSQLNGYELWLHESNSFLGPNNNMVGGYTVCATRAIHVGLGSTSFPHELAHALQGCEAPLPQDEGKDRDHADWTRDGIDGFIELAAP